jgi:hypothetical protein
MAKGSNRSLRSVTDDYWICLWLEVSAVNREDFVGFEDFQAAKLLNTMLKRFMHYLVNTRSKVRDVGEEQKMSSEFKKWAQNLEAKNDERMLLEYGPVFRAIPFSVVVSMNDLLTKDTVYAGFEFLGVESLRILLEKMEGNDILSWTKELDEVEEEIYSLSLDPENMVKLSRIIYEICD